MRIAFRQEAIKIYSTVWMVFKQEAIKMGYAVYGFYSDRRQSVPVNILLTFAKME
jgi:hypothetical protein